MDCREVENSVFAIAENRLPREIQESIERHFAQCEKCRLLAACLTDLTAEPEDLEPSPFFWHRLKDRIEEYEAGSSARWGRFVPALRPVALAACVLLGIGAGIHLGSEYTARYQPSVEDSLEEAEADALPYVAILDGVPHGSLAEILLEESYMDGSKR